MATMNISLPNEMKCWVEEQALTGRYSNSRDYMRDLIRRDQDRASKVAQLQLLITEGLESGVGEQSMSDLKEQAIRLLANRAAQAKADIAAGDLVDGERFLDALEAVKHGV